MRPAIKGSRLDNLWWQSEREQDAFGDDRVRRVVGPVPRPLRPLGSGYALRADVPDSCVERQREVRQRSVAERQRQVRLHLGYRGWGKQRAEPRLSRAYA